MYQCTDKFLLCVKPLKVLRSFERGRYKIRNITKLRTICIFGCTRVCVCVLCFNKKSRADFLSFFRFCLCNRKCPSEYKFKMRRMYEKIFITKIFTISQKIHIYNIYFSILNREQKYTKNFIIHTKFKNSQQQQQQQHPTTTKLK